MPRPDPRSRPRRRPSWSGIAAIALVVAALAAAWHYTPLSELITAERVSRWAQTVREVPWAPVAVIAVYVPATFVLFPRPVLTILTVLAFGPWLGFVYAMSGIIAAALAAYYVGRALPDKTFRRLIGERFEQVGALMRRHGYLSVGIARIVPAAPFALESMAAGAMRLKVLPYVVGTFVGMLPGVLAETVFGTQIAAFLDDPSEINYWLVGTVLLALAAVIYGVRRWAAAKTE